MFKKTVIGVSGFARSGKDAFSSILLNRLSSIGAKGKTFSFASNLKADINDFCLNKVGFSAFTEDPRSKEIIRPLLISYGNLQRNASNGSYWFKKLKPEIDSFLEKDGDVAIIPDLRFKEYEFDEYDFVRSYSNNFVVTISKRLADGSLNPPAHESEAKSAAFFVKNSNFNLLWDESPDPACRLDASKQCIDDIITHIKHIQ
jgi:hypothetical protein